MFNLPSKDELQSLLLAGMTIKQLAEMFFVHFQAMYRHIKSFEDLEFLPNKGRKIDPKIVKKIRRDLMRTNLSPSQIQIKHGLKSRSIVYRVRRWMIEEEMERDMKQSPLMAFKESAKVRHCPEHGQVNVWPCVACEAKRARANQRPR